jgi:murein DD-endopeptidase MepM/ murein hydrolase activator NlpD
MTNRHRGGLGILTLALLLSLSPLQASPPDGSNAVFSTGAPPQGSGGGEHIHESGEPITAQQREEAWRGIRDNMEKLGLGQRKNQPGLTSIPQLGWPLLANGISDPGYHAISNFVDQDPSGGWIADYNCGTRTYDGHQGTDFYLWPFSWRKMDNNHVYVVAGAPGTIVYKSNGNFDRSCTVNGNNWNAVYISHADGSVAWYGHLKNGSLTSKSVGASVVQGEYLGVVGSSGSSTEPHLHLELYDSNSQLVDPYQGSCNALNAFSAWQVQRPYYDSALNKMTTGSAAAVFPSCSNAETPNESSTFSYGQTIYFTAYYRDQRSIQQSQYRILRPNGTVHTSWTHNGPAAHYPSSWWYWYWNNFAPSGPSGTWRFEITFNGQTYTKNFTMVP